MLCELAALRRARSKSLSRLVGLAYVCSLCPLSRLTMRRARAQVEEAAGSAKELAMLDERVNKMLDSLRAELDQADGSIGQASGRSLPRCHQPRTPPLATPLVRGCACEAVLA